jgi:hypothetical protein
MAYNYKLIIYWFLMFWGNIAYSQIRNQSTHYVELMAGTPIIADNSLLQYYYRGERYYGACYALGTNAENYHRISVDYRKEFVDSTLLYYENSSIKYTYESTIAKGKYHMSFLGLVIGAGLGFEREGDKSQEKPGQIAYPFLTLGLNFEKYIAPPFGLFIRAEANGTTSPISRKLKANLGFGIKIRIIKNKH